jgi:transposase-like protein
MRKSQRPREKWEEVVEQYEKSGLTQAQYAQSRGVALSTLQSWLRRKRAQAAGAEVRLLPVQVVTPPPEQLSRAVAAGLEVVVPGGVRLSVAPGTDVQYVARLVEALRAC